MPSLRAGPPGERGEREDQDGHERREISVGLLNQRMQLGDRTDLSGAQRPPRAAHPGVGHTDGTPEHDKAVGRDHSCQRKHPDPVNTCILSTRTSAPTISSCTRAINRALNYTFTLMKLKWKLPEPRSRIVRQPLARKEMGVRFGASDRRCGNAACA